MAGARIFVLILWIGLCLGAEDPQPPRPTRTIARFFGLDTNAQPQPQVQQHPAGQHPHQQQQPQPQQVPVASQARKPIPLIYSVKYYDRTGEGEKVEVVPDAGAVQDRVQGVPARVFLNVYTGQQTPVYYDNKGQVLVPCPVYDHLYVAGVDQSLIRKPTPSKFVQSQVAPVQPPVQQQVQPVPQIVPVPEFVYYASPSYVGHNPVPPPKTNHGHGGLTFVGVPYDYPYFSGIFPYGSTGGFNNPYVYLKPTPPGHIHNGGHPGQPPATVVQLQQPVAHVVEKKEGEKVD